MSTRERAAHQATQAAHREAAARVSELEALVERLTREGRSKQEGLQVGSITRAPGWKGRPWMHSGSPRSPAPTHPPFCCWQELQAQVQRGGRREASLRQQVRPSWGDLAHLRTTCRLVHELWPL